MTAHAFRGIGSGEDDRRLVAHVHPPAWVQPEPRGRYNLVVVGGGTAGLVSAMGAAGLGARVALCERELLGGDCLVTGCVPSKALLRSAHAAHHARNAAHLGVQVTGVTVDGPAVMDRLRRLRADIAPHDAAARAREAGVDVYLGDARFTGPDTVEVNGRTLRFARAVVATGGRARLPDVPGLPEAGALTHVEAFALERPPRRLAVLGAGPIGCELAQAFARLGTEVTLLETEDRTLPRDDPDAADVVRRSLERDVRLLLGARVQRVERTGELRRLHVDGPVGAEVLEVDAVLVAAGRAPNVEDLGLDRAGVETDGRGIVTDDFLRTSNPRIYAAGDVAGRWAFTHAADAMARLVLRNALFWGRSRVSALHVPWCTYTDPELAHVGLLPAEARGRGAVTLTAPFEDNDRAIVDEETAGFARVHVDARKGTVLGATVVGAGAGEAIAEMALAVQSGLSLDHVAATIHPYPTRSEAWKRLGDAWQRRKLTPSTAALLRRVLAFRR